MAKIKNTANIKLSSAAAVGGDFGINLLLILMGAFMFLPMLLRHHAVHEAA